MPFAEDGGCPGIIPPREPIGQPFVRPAGPGGVDLNIGARHTLLMEVPRLVFDAIKGQLEAYGKRERIIPGKGEQGRDFLDLNGLALTYTPMSGTSVPLELATIDQIHQEVCKRFHNVAMIGARKQEGGDIQAWRWAGDHTYVIGLLETLKFNVMQAKMDGTEDLETDEA